MQARAGNLLTRSSGLTSTAPNAAKSNSGTLAARCRRAAPAPPRRRACFTHALTSSWGMRPFGPLPCTARDRRPSSRANLRTDGPACAAEAGSSIGAVSRRARRWRRGTADAGRGADARAPPPTRRAGCGCGGRGGAAAAAAAASPLHASTTSAPVDTSSPPLFTCTASTTPGRSTARPSWPSRSQVSPAALSTVDDVARLHQHVDDCDVLEIADIGHTDFDEHCCHAVLRIGGCSGSMPSFGSIAVAHRRPVDAAVVGQCLQRRDTM